MTPTALLASLRASGFTLRPEGGLLLVSPASRLTGDQRAALIAHKPALLALLAEEETGPTLTEMALAQGHFDPWKWTAGVPCLLVEIGGVVLPWKPEEWERVVRDLTSFHAGRTGRASVTVLRRERGKKS